MKNVDLCVILCGGKSSRLRGKNGEIKALLPFGDKSLILYNFDKMNNIFKCVFIVCKANQVNLIEKSLGDSYKNQSDIFIIESTDIFAPIVGIITALTKLQKERIFFISCDCPFVSYHTIQTICESAHKYDIVFARDSNKSHPLVAVWSVKVLPLLIDSLIQGDFKLQNIINKAHSKALSFELSEFFNINTQENYVTALKMLSQNSNVNQTLT